jgi:hypothetical protein
MTTFVNLSTNYLFYAYSTLGGCLADESKRKLLITFLPVLWIQVWIHRIHMFLGLPDPDPLVRGVDTDPYPEPSIIMQK